MSEADSARTARSADPAARLVQFARLIGSAAAAAAIVMLSSAGPAEAQAAPVTGVDGSPMVFTFVVDNANDPAGLLFGSAGTYGITDTATVRVRVDWGDGATQDITSVGIVEHPYSTPGTYTVRVWPLFADQGGSDTGPWLTLYGMGRTSNSYYAWPAIEYARPHARMTEVRSFGDLGIEALTNAFTRHEHLTSVPATLPASVTELNFTFADASAFDGDITGWDVSRVTTMAGMFSGSFKDPVFNRDISSWDVSNVTTMAKMFEGTLSFNRDISSWDVASVTTMSSMFAGARSFDRPLDRWDVSNVTSMSLMFSGAGSFDQPLNSWNVTNVTTMQEMFRRATSFDQPLDNWNVTNVRLMLGMFDGATSFDQDLGDWSLNPNVDLTEMLDSSGLSVACYDETLIGWAALGVSGLRLEADGLSSSPAAAAARSTLENDLNWRLSDDGDGGVAVGDCAPVAATSAGPAPGPTVSCSPSAPTAGVEVTCSVAGGDPSVEILWAATSDGVTIASTGVTLGPDGAGTFRFTMPASAVGRPLLVELVGWTAPVAIGEVAGGPVPTRVPAGEGPGAFGTTGGPATAATLGMLTMLTLGVASALTARAGASALHAGPRRARPLR